MGFSIEQNLNSQLMFNKNITRFSAHLLINIHNLKSKEQYENKAWLVYFDLIIKIASAFLNS